MSFYRKLNINGIDYQYNIGKSFVKIKSVNGSKDIPIVKIVPEGGRRIVHPQMIKDYINGEKKHISCYYRTCTCKNVDKYLRSLPFDFEIHNIKHYVYFCENCFEENARSI